VINAKLPPGMRALEVRELAAGEPPLSRAVKGAKYAVRLESDEHVGRAAEAIGNGWKEQVPALRAISLDGDELTFEVNLDQAAGETATAKKVLESLLGIPPEAQLSLSVSREATVLG
jgi:hypothetical protein